jgi:hypothetical protein
VHKDREILLANQSGFRAEYRLQTRVLLLIEQIPSCMSNSSPVANVFVDFKNAFNQLCFEGCLGKLTRMGIPVTFIRWIRIWLEGRRATREIRANAPGGFHFVVVGYKGRISHQHSSLPIMLIWRTLFRCPCLFFLPMI